MSKRERYQTPADLPSRIPVFPLRGALLLPRVVMPLNIFEPRYISMVDDALSGSRIIGIVQPRLAGDDTESPAGKSVELRGIGTAGRLVAFNETDGNRYLITLAGVSRFEILSEVESPQDYRICEVSFDRFAGDLHRGLGEESVDRERLLSVLKAYLEAQSMKADWAAIGRSGNELLVNTLSMLSPHGPEEKQALLEAKDLATRAQILIALAEMQLAAPDDGSGTAMQ